MANIGMGRRLAVGAVIALCGTASYAYDYDTTGKAGKFDTTKSATLVKGSGGSFNAVRVWCPYILDESDTSGFNAAAVQNVNGNLVGVVSTFVSGGAGGVPALAIVGTVDNTPSPCTGGMASNDVIIAEFSASDSLGTLLADGTVVFRENFAGPEQNNIAFETGITGVGAQPCAPDDVPTNKVFNTNSCGMDSMDTTGLAQLGTPGALRNTGALWTGVTTFGGAPLPSGFCVYNGVGVWAGTGNLGNAPLARWEQELSPLPTGVLAADVRQTQPVIRMVDRPSGGSVPYACFGVGFINAPLSGSSARPYYMVVDEITSGGGYDADTVYIEGDKAPGGGQAGNRVGDAGYDLPNTTNGLRFVDHVATGGGGEPFINSQFDMNAKGEVVAIFEDLNADPRLYQVRLYRPIWNVGGTRIIGYQAPVVIADNVADTFIVDSVQTTGAAPTFTLLTLIPFSGVSIANNSAIAYAAVTAKNETFRNLDGDPGTPDNVVLLNTTTGLYYVEPTTGSTHELIKGGQAGDTLLDTSASGQKDLAIGPFAVDRGSDGFNREGLSKDGSSLIANFRDGGNENGVDQDADLFADLGGWLKNRGSAPGTGEQSVRGTLTLNVGAFTATPVCPGDIDGDHAVGLSDVAKIIQCWGAIPPTFPVGCVGNAANIGSNTAVIGLDDIAVVIANWAHTCP